MLHYSVMYITLATTFFNIVETFQQVVLERPTTRPRISLFPVILHFKRYGVEGTCCISLFPEILHFQRSGQRALVHISISINSAFLDVGGEVTYSISILPGILHFLSSGGGTYYISLFPGILQFQRWGVEGPSATISRNSAIPEVGGGGTQCHDFQEFCNSRGGGWRDLVPRFPGILQFQRSGWRDLVPRFPGILQFQRWGVEGPSSTISRNSAIPEVGVEGPSSTISRNSVVPEVGGGGTYC